jgi:hypothetical protein
MPEMTARAAHRIELPSAMKIHSIRDLLRSREFYPASAPARFVLSFHPKYSQFEPFALAMLAAWARLPVCSLMGP